MNVKQLVRSFAGGELTPELYGRIDLVKFQTGLKTCRNFLPLPHGPAANRPGTKYVLEVKDSSKATRIVPFVYNAEQSYVLEFGDQYIRIHTNGGSLLEATTTITGVTQANPGVVTTSAAHGYSNGDWVYLASVAGMTQVNGRYFKVAGVTATTFQLTHYGAGTNTDTSSYGAYSSGGTAARVYTISSPYLEADLFDLHFVQSADVLTITHEDYAPRTLSRVSATSWTLATISFASSLSAPTGLSATPTGAGAVAYYYKVSAVGSDPGDESAASASTTCNNNLATAGNYNTVAWSAVTGALRYNVYKQRNGLYGYIGQTDSTSFVDDNITADTADTPPEVYNPFSGAGNYPRAAAYYQQRRWLAGTTNQPQTVWGTASATDSNMNYTIPSQDSDSIEVTLAARQAHVIRHIVPLSDLILLSSEGEWQITGQNTDVLTPSSIDPRPRSYVGASNVQPVVTGNSILYVQAQGSHVREFRFYWEANTYRSTDVSLMAPHLFDGYRIVDLGYSRAPQQVCWAVRSDGTLLSLTYVPDQEVISWAHHDTDGLFESVAVAAENNEDVPYFVVKRTINGRTVRHIEYMASRTFSALADAYFVDGGATYSGSAATSISGLWHLEGESVSILADGAVLPAQTVSSGAVTLATAASKVHIGLPYTADVETLPFAVDKLQAFGQGALKNVNKVQLRVHRSSGVFAGPDAAHLTEYRRRTTEPYGSPPSLVSDEISIVVSPKWDASGGLFLRQSEPLPITLVSMTMDVAIGG